MSYSPDRILGMGDAEEAGWMIVVLLQSGCPIDSSGGSDVSGSIEGFKEQLWSPYMDAILYCCSTRTGEG